MGRFCHAYGGPLVVAILLTLFQFLYVILDVVPSFAAEVILRNTLPVCLVIWMQDDARFHRKTPCFDFGLFLTGTFPLSILGYLAWSRGVRGLLVALYFLGLAILPALAAELVLGSLNK